MLKVADLAIRGELVECDICSFGDIFATDYGTLYCKYKLAKVQTLRS